MSFPLLNMWNIKKLADAPDAVTTSAKGAWYQELSMRYVRWSTYIFLALVYHYTFDMNWAKELNPEWIAYVFLRNYLLMGIMYGGWHWFLFDSAFASVIRKKKFHPKLPSDEQMYGDHNCLF